MSAQQATFYVDAGRGDDVKNDGSSAVCPFRTITKAIQAANAAALPSKIVIEGKK